MSSYTPASPPAVMGTSTIHDSMAPPSTTSVQSCRALISYRAVLARLKRLNRQAACWIDFSDSMDIGAPISLITS
jgi:hypothetical protein